MKGTLLLLALPICFSLGCKKKDIAVPDQNLNALFGSWDLIKKWGGFSGCTETPLTMGYQQTVKFDKDGGYYTYKDDSRMDQDKFEFEYQAEGSHAPYDMHYVIRYEKSTFSQWVHIQNDTLYLGDAFADDGYNYLYVKKY